MMRHYTMGQCGLPLAGIPEKDCIKFVWVESSQGQGRVTWTILHSEWRIGCEGFCLCSKLRLVQVGIEASLCQ